MNLVAYSDYLCPWCFNGSVRLKRRESEFSGQVSVEYRAFLLRPKAQDSERDLQKFIDYTRSWSRPAGEEDSGEFHVWQSEAAPPSHSIPAHQVAKAAADLGPDAFGEIHARLLLAYFRDNRDISDPATLKKIWSEAGLPEHAFDAREDPRLLQQIVQEHNEAIEVGVNGVPSVMLRDQRIPVAGAQPIDFYRRWVNRALAGEIKV